MASTASSLRQKIRDKFDSFIGRDLSAPITIARQTYVHNPATQQAEVQERLQKTVGMYQRTEDIFDPDGMVRQTNQILMVPAQGLKFPPEAGDLIRFPNGTTVTISTVDRVGPTNTTLLYRLAVV